MISLIDDELLFEAQSRGFFANIFVNEGHDIYMCTERSDLGKVNETSVCGNYYYKTLPMDQDLMKINYRAFDYLVVAPANTTADA